LALFMLTLLDWSEGCEFVAVANACTDAEQAFLKSLARRRPRLHYMALPLKQQVRHAVALHHLVKTETRQQFCFLDNDILADGEFLPSLIAAARSSVGVFACPPIWSDAASQTHCGHWRRLKGRSHRTDSGLVVGTTYLAIYDIAALREVLQTGARFDQTTWDALSPAIRAKLDAIGMQKDRYDTAKVVNLMLIADGHRLAHLDLPNLHHVGGMSEILKDARHGNRPERIAATLTDLSADERAVILSNGARREATAIYVDGLLSHLFDDAVEPRPAHTGDDLLDERIAHLGEVIRRAHARYAPELEPT
jgi:hypothetical protein